MNIMSLILASLADLVQNHSSYHNLQQNNTIEDFSESLSEDEDMALIEEEIESNDADNSPASSVTSPMGVESLQGNGTFSLVNKQRFFLSMFMFAFMFLGPGKMLFGEKNGMFYSVLSVNVFIVCFFQISYR